MMQWYLIDETNGDSFGECLNTSSKAVAVREMVAQWNHLSDHDKKRRRSFYVAYMEANEDGIDYDSMDECVELSIPSRDISIDNGAHFSTVDNELMEQIEEHNLWDSIVEFMDENTREIVHNAFAPCSDRTFLETYLMLAPNDLVIG